MFAGRLLLLFCWLILLTSLGLAAEPASKLSAPDAEAQAQANKLVKEVYGAEWTAAKTFIQKQTLAKKLLLKARESGNDRAGQFVLLRLSKDIAAQAPDVTAAFDAIAELDKLFQVDVLDLQADALAKASPAATTADQYKTIVAMAVDVADRAVVKGKYEIAKQASELEVSAARKSKDPALIKQSTLRKTNIHELAAAFDEATAALDVLDKTPTDPDANFAVGKYYCFAEGNWKKGLPMLAIGSDAALRSLAEAEIKTAPSAEDQVAIGDQWWDYGEKAGPKKKSIQVHAIDWYQQALPMLTGLTKDRIQKRVNEYPGRPGSEQTFLSLDAVIDLFQLPESKWTKEDSVLHLAVSDVDFIGRGKFWSKELWFGEFEFGYKVKSKAYQLIGAKIDGAAFQYSRGHWFNKATAVRDGAKELRIEGVVDSSDKWIPLVVNSNGNSVEFYYNGKLEWTGPMPTAKDGKRSVKFGFGGYESTIALKDFYFKLK